MDAHVGGGFAYLVVSMFGVGREEEMGNGKEVSRLLEFKLYLCLVHSAWSLSIVYRRLLR
jgi:hypothetical protein